MQDMHSDTLEALWRLKKHYDARLPEDVRLVPIPQQISDDNVQTWLIQNIIEEEKALAQTETDGSGVGAVTWRKSLWKRVVNRIEANIAAQSDVDAEVHEEIFFYLSSLMAQPAPLTGGTYLRRFHYSWFQGKTSMHSILTREDEAAISGGTTGLHTWPAALFLANHVLSHPELVTDAHLLELGSGAGMLAVLASQVQRTGSGTIISSDFHDAVLRRLRYNIEANLEIGGDIRRIEVAKVDWSDPAAFHCSKPLDLILATDVIYDPDLAMPLASCLAHILQANTGCSALISQTVRNEETILTFLRACSSSGLMVEEIEPRQPCRSMGMVMAQTVQADVKLFQVLLQAE